MSASTSSPDTRIGLYQSWLVALPLSRDPVLFLGNIRCRFVIAGKNQLMFGSFFNGPYCCSYSGSPLRYSKSDVPQATDLSWGGLVLKEVGVLAFENERSSCRQPKSNGRACEGALIYGCNYELKAVLDGCGMGI
jgi:hypothetical protein